MNTIQSVDQPSMGRLAIGYWTHAILPIGWWLFFVVLFPLVMEPILDIIIIPSTIIPLWFLSIADSFFIRYPVFFALAIIVLILADGIVYVSLQSPGNSQFARWWRFITLLLQAILTLEVGLALFVSLVLAATR
jgi:hypothetical protein